MNSFYTIFADMPRLLGWREQQCVPNAVGWELNKGRKVPRCINLAKSMDPTR